jgi:hypothetical protein
MRYLLILTALLAGCATPEQRAEKDIAKYAPYCEKLGYEKQGDKWRECIRAEAADDKAARSRASSAIIQSRPKTCQTVGNTTTCY